MVIAEFPLGVNDKMSVIITWTWHPAVSDRVKVKANSEFEGRFSWSLKYDTTELCQHQYTTLMPRALRQPQSLSFNPHTPIIPSL